MNFNKNFNDVADSYLFAEVASRVAAFSRTHSDKKIIKLGIGDVTLPLVPEVIKAMHAGVEDMSKQETFKGYGPYEGYAFLRESIQSYYKESGVNLGLSEIFVSDGANSFRRRNRRKRLSSYARLFLGRRFNLYLLAQQSHGRGIYKGSAQRMGRFRQCKARGNFIRRRLRMLCIRRKPCPFYISDRGRKNLRNRVLLVLQNRGFHGYALRLYRSSRRA